MRRPRLSYANVTATLALFVALGGGAYAAIQLPPNSVGTKQLKRNAVRSSKVKDHALQRRDLKLGAFATPQQLAGLVHGSGHVISAQFTGTSHPATQHFVPVPGGGWIALLCDASGYDTAYTRAAGDPRTYDVFEASLVNNGSATTPNVQYLRSAPGNVFLFGSMTGDSQRTYDVSSSAGYAHVTVLGHYDTTTKTCTVKARGFSRP